MFLDHNHFSPPYNVDTLLPLSLSFLCNREVWCQSYSPFFWSISNSFFIFCTKSLPSFMCAVMIRSNLIMYFIIFILWETKYCQLISDFMESVFCLYSSVSLTFCLQFFSSSLLILYCLVIVKSFWSFWVDNLRYTLYLSKCSLKFFFISVKFF